jgi:hypothetical protein
VKSKRIVTGNRSTADTAAFVRGAAMQSPGSCTAALSGTLRLALRWVDGSGPLHPGEGFA